MSERVFTTREREDLFVSLASRPEGVTSPEVYQQALTQGDKVTREAYQNLARRLVHRGILVIEDGSHPARYRPGQSVDGQWLEEEELANLISDEYPILALPIWKESLRQIRQVPEDWWRLLREKLKGEGARTLFERAIVSYCGNLAALIAMQAEAITNGATSREIAQKREEGRNEILLLQGLVRFGLGISAEAVQIPDSFDHAVRTFQDGTQPEPIKCDLDFLSAEFKMRVESGPLIKIAEDSREESLLVCAHRDRV
ncbi:MAG TPA: hypothetical protein VGX94_00700 [Terriglobia bacterium]|nr:hypothetical protein [Terriglobia bacterium]